ncbi:MAG: hypothetical protein GXZ13_07480 [Synergistaceae bacterium]|nr:hypothetical protein [Synergistaceae bacterium]
MNRRNFLFIGLLLLGLVILVGCIGGKKLNKKDLEELLEIQADFADFLYNNYEFGSYDELELEKLEQEYNDGQGDMTNEEFLDEMAKLEMMQEVEKIEFIGYEISPMNSLEMFYKVNDIFEGSVYLDTISAEAGKLKFSGPADDGQELFPMNKKHLDKPIGNLTFPRELIIFYEGGLDG